MDNPETLATLGTQDTGQINVRENRGGNKEWTIQRRWHYWEHKTLDEDKQNTKTHNTTQKTKKMNNTDPTKNPG